MQIVCPHCAAGYDVPLTFRGRGTTCKACRRRFVVGEAAEVELPGIERAGVGRWVLPVAAAGIVVLAAVVALIIVLGRTGGGQATGDGGRAAPPSRERESIERVLQVDAGCVPGARSVAEVVGRMRAIATAGCPADFRVAYLAHLHAWELLADVEREAANFRAEANEDGVLIESFLRGLLGDPLGKANELRAAQTELQRHYQTAQQQIKQTFHRVEEVAVLHGASLPR